MPRETLHSNFLSAFNSETKHLNEVHSKTSIKNNDDADLILSHFRFYPCVPCDWLASSPDSLTRLSRKPLAGTISVDAFHLVGGGGRSAFFFWFSFDCDSTGIGAVKYKKEHSGQMFANANLRLEETTLLPFFHFQLFQSSLFLVARRRWEFCCVTLRKPRGKQNSTTGAVLSC